MSTVPTMTPIATISSASTQTCADRITDPASVVAASCAWTGGSVSRCTTSANTPTTQQQCRGQRTGLGNTATDSPTDNGGPAMNVTSSSTVSKE